MQRGARAAWVALTLIVSLTVLACGSPSGGPPRVPTASAPAPAASTAAPAGSAARAPAAPTAPAPSATSSDEPQFAARTEPYRVKISYPSINGSMTTIWVGQDAGIFRKYGIDADIQFISSTTVGVQALIAGDIDFSFLAGTAGPEAIVAGAPLRIVAGTENRIVQSLLAKPEIASLAELRGKRLGITRLGSLTDYSARYLLQKVGLVPDQDVAFVQVNGMPEILAAMQAGAVDAGTVSPPQIGAGLKEGYRSLADMWLEPLDYPAQYLATSVRNLEQRPDLVRRMVYATAEALYRTRTDRRTTEETIGRYMQTDNAEEIAEAYDAYLPGRQRAPLVSEAAIERVLKDIAPNHPQAAQMSAKALLDTRYAEEAVASGFVDRLYKQ